MIIVTATNDAYARHLAVMLTSLLEHCKSRELLEIYVIDGNLSESVKEKLEKTVARYGQRIHFLKVEDQWFESFAIYPKFDYLTKETYYRIAIPRLLPSHVTKAIYLDCDMIVEQDIAKLWRTDLGKYWLAAVDTSDLWDAKGRRRRTRRIELPADSPYFNAGVLYINIKQWRKHQVMEQLIAFIAHPPHPLKYMDQDALNAVVHRKWIKLHPKWNCTTRRLREKPPKKAAIIHFTGRRKPWNTADHPYAALYQKYMKLSMWNQNL